MSAEVPSDSARTRSIVIVVVVIVALVVLAIVVWSAISADDDGTAKQTAIEPAEETSTQPRPATPLATSTTTPSAGPTTPPSAAPVTAEPSILGSNKVAFTLGGRIYVANADGSGAVSVAPAGGAYSLSPDGARLAVAYDTNAQQTTGGAVAVFDTLTGAMSPLGSQAFPEAPQWAPDTSWLVYTSGTETLAVKRAETVGGSGITLAKTGASPRVSPKGEFIAFGVSQQPGPSDKVTIARTDGGGSAVLGSSDGALSWAWGPRGELYFTRPGIDATTWDLWVAAPPRFSAKKVGSANLAAPAYLMHGLAVSPDGAYVLAVATGDDEYSRMWMFDVGQRRFSSISTRRDAYPSGWSADGAVLYFEGNVYQGEPSALMSIRPDGTGRHMVVSGAQR